jgi:hypothetical protein
VLSLFPTGSPGKVQLELGPAAVYVPPAAAQSCAGEAAKPTDANTKIAAASATIPVSETTSRFMVLPSIAAVMKQEPGRSRLGDTDSMPAYREAQTRDCRNAHYSRRLPCGLSRSLPFQRTQWWRVESSLRGVTRERSRNAENAAVSSSMERGLHPTVTRRNVFRSRRSVEAHLRGPLDHRRRDRRNCSGGPVGSWLRTKGRRAERCRERSARLEDRRSLALVGSCSTFRRRRRGVRRADRTDQEITFERDHEASEARRRKVEQGPASRAYVECGAVDLRGNRNAVAVSDDLAARDLGRVGENRVELLLAEPRGGELRRLHTLLRRLRESERTPCCAQVDATVKSNVRSLDGFKDNQRAQSP